MSHFAPVMSHEGLSQADYAPWFKSRNFVTQCCVILYHKMTVLGPWNHMEVSLVQARRYTLRRLEITPNNVPKR